VFCVDYSDELDIIVSGSADTTVKVWSMSSGGCHVTRYGHSDWVVKVIYECKIKTVAFVYKGSMLWPLVHDRIGL
jgi:F-box/WD-40 domain protein 2